MMEVGKQFMDSCSINLISAAHELAGEMSKCHAVMRSFMHVCVKRFVRPSGCYIDLGSGKQPSYLQYLKNQDFDYISADGNPMASPDIVIDLEKAVPIKDKSVDGVLLLNVLEHVYEHRRMLTEIHRILNDNGKLYVLVPFLIKIHGSPLDYYRFTHFALQRMLADAGFNNIRIYANVGIFQYLCLLLNWLPKSISLTRYLLYPLFLALCGLDAFINRLPYGKLIRPLPVGYFITCST